MCLIVQRKKDQNISKEFFEDVWKKNNDGWGIAWASGVGDRRKSKMKTGMEFDRFWETYNSLQSSNVPCFVHFRYATQGKPSKELCHPFEVAPGIYMMHNGSLDTPSSAYDKTAFSDTWAFADQVIKPLLKGCEDPKQAVRNPLFLYIMKELIGNNNRMVFLDVDGATIVPTANWSKTTQDVVVSNSYAYTMYNPTHWKYRQQQTHNAYGRDRWDDYCDYTKEGYFDSNGNWREGAKPEAKAGSTSQTASTNAAAKGANVVPIANSNYTGYKAPEKKETSNTITKSSLTNSDSKRIEENVAAANSLLDNGGAKATGTDGGAAAAVAELKKPQVVLPSTEEVAKYSEQEEYDNLVEYLEELDQQEDAEELELLEHATFLAGDDAYAEELAYQDPALAARLLNFLIDGGY